MASDGPGKYREKKSRSNKPYERPKGIIRRVTDSVTGLFSASWLSGWMAGEEEEEDGGAGEPQPGPSSQPPPSTLAPPGESFIFAQPSTSTTRRPFPSFYPEEGETEGTSSQPCGTEGEEAGRLRLTSGSLATSQPLQLNAEIAGPSLGGRRQPLLSSTPMFGRNKAQGENRALPLITTSTPGDDGSEGSESSGETGVDASVIPRPDERDYQREILQLDEESLQTLRDSLAKTVSATPQPAAANILPSLEETRKRPRDLEADHSSLRAEGSLSGKSLFSEGEMSHSQPQPSALASKRPRFNVSVYGSPVTCNKSVLSDSTFKASPYYPGRTMYGGASAYRRSRLQTRTPHQTTRAHVKAKAIPEATDGGLSQAARRILESLEKMSTPISDAKRIPTPTLGQRGSFLDSVPPYTTSYHRIRPHLRTPAPPVAKLLTPTKVSLQDNRASTLLANTSTSTSHTSGPMTHRRQNLVVQPEATTEKEGSPKVEKASEQPPTSSSTQSSQTAPEPPSKLSFPQPVPPTTTAFNPPPEIFKFGVSSNFSASQPRFEFTPKPVAPETSSYSSPPTKKAGGKMKSKVVDSGRGSGPAEEEMVEEPQLPAVSLHLPSLPKINLNLPSPVSTKPVSSPEGFKFSIPEVMDSQLTSPVLSSAPTFTFRNPALVGEENPREKENLTTSPLMFNRSNATFAPKLKADIKQTASSLTAGTLKQGSILDILKPKETQPNKAPVSNSVEEKANSSDFSKTPKETETTSGFKGFGLSFVKSSDEWDCSVCMVRNKSPDTKCVACETSKPGQTVNSPAVNVDNKASGTVTTSTAILGSGWGDAFKKSASEWECDTCMLRNSDGVDKCVACESPRPGGSGRSSSRCSSSASDPVKTATDSAGEDKAASGAAAVVGFGAAFTKRKGEWECDTCLVRNKSDATKCISCETPKPGASNVSQAITGNFKFGTNATSDSSASPMFKFGFGNSQTDVKSSGISFGVSAKSSEEKDSKTSDTGFKFGVSSEKNAFSVGVAPNPSSSNSNGEEAKKTAQAPMFQFGVTVEVKDKGVEKEPATTSLASVPFGGTLPACNASPAFQFSSGKDTQAALVSKRGTNSAVEETSLSNTKVSVAQELKAGSVLDELKKQTESVTKQQSLVTFSSKDTKADKEVCKPSFTFNSIPLASEKVEHVNSTNSIDFGKPAAPATTEPVAAPFGGSQVTSVPAASPFSFGEKEGKPSPFRAFSFTAPSASKDEQSGVQFSFGAKKRDASETTEPAKKLSFGSVNKTQAVINNGVASSLFSFGSKENKLGSGTGFGAPPTTTPAFGAPAPSSNAVPSFQFGNSNPPTPAAIAPAPAFGNPAPAFGSATSAFGGSSNTSSSGFAFGQPSEKKPSTGFDFGEAAKNSGSAQGFNFGAAAQSPPNNLFQFGQSQVNNNNSGGLFQFGSNSEVAPAPAFGGGENPFSSPAPPSGRVMKKAVRRTRK